MPDTVGSRKPDAPARWELRHWAAVTVVLLAILALGWVTRRPTVSGADESTYILLSHSLEKGSYRDEFLVGRPPHTQYPPGTPAWLLLVRQVGGPSEDAGRLANLILIALSALLLGDALRRLGHAWLGVAAIGIVGLNYDLLHAGGTLLSEPPYTVLSMLALWATLRADQRPGRGSALLAGAAAVASALTRSIGVVLVAAVGVWSLLRRRWGLAVALTVVAGAALGGWFWYVTSHAPQTVGASYSRDLANASRGLSERVITNLRDYSTRSLPQALGVPAVPGTPIDNIAWILALLGFGGAGLLVLLRKWPAAALALLGSTAILLVWPWPVRRLLTPLVPLLVAMLLLGASEVGRRFRLRHSEMPACALLLVLAGFTVARQVKSLRTEGRCDRDNPFGPAGCFSAEERSMMMAARFAHDSLPADAVLLGAKPAEVHHYSGRATLPLALITRETDPFARVRAYNFYVILSREVTLERAKASRVLYSRCRELRVRARFAPSALLLEPRDTLASGADACPALAAFLADTVPDWSWGRR
jgi:4-amino-4-deoxy-L-arabinose transferase-like glycosyltransferase